MKYGLVRYKINTFLVEPSTSKSNCSQNSSKEQTKNRPNKSNPQSKSLESDEIYCVTKILPEPQPTNDSTAKKPSARLLHVPFSARRNSAASSIRTLFRFKSR